MVVQGREEGGLNLGGENGDGKKCMELIYICT